MKQSWHKIVFQVLVWAGLALLVVWVIRNVSFREAWEILQDLHPWQWIVLLLVDGVILLTFSSRWWFLLRASGFHIRYLRLAGYRLAAFAISYFTPGTQFGGEPLQVHMVQSQDSVPPPIALASVALEKLLELIANFTILTTGVALILASNLLPGLPRLPLVLAAVGLLLLPLVYLLAVYREKLPATRLLIFLDAHFPGNRALCRILPVVQSSEQAMVQLFRRSYRLLVVIALLSIGTWLLIILEYWLMVAFLGERLNVVQVIAALTAARAAFLLPIPGGLGALEGSQVFVMQAFGFEPSLGLSIGLLIRARDVTFGLLGLLLVAVFVRKLPQDAGASRVKIPKR